jgi:hypothetical protein
MQALPISQLVGPRYVDLVNDLLRMITIQSTIQFMYWAADDADTVHLLSSDFVLLLLFIVLGVALYHLVIKQMVSVS